jgi:glycopeptide antibiotics resistance protein
MTKLQLDQRSNYLRLAAVYILGLSLLVLWPFDFHVPFSFEKNNVRWMLGTNGVEFPSVGIIRLSSSGNRLHDALVSGTGVTVEVWAATMNDQQEGPARIVSYSKDPGSRNFTLAQNRRDLVMRLRTTETDSNGRPVLTVRGVFQPDDPQHLVVTYNFFEQHVYVNGHLRLRAPIPGGRFSNWDPSYSLVLGNEATGNRPWLGKLFLVAIYNRALSEQEIWKNYAAGRFFDPTVSWSDQRARDGLLTLYLFSEGKGNRVLERSRKLSLLDLNIPPRVPVIITDREFLSSPYREFFSRSVKSHRVIEIIGNIIIFIPFGLFLHAALRGRYQLSLKIAAFVLILGALFTLSIESLQYFTETRHSSMTDVISNLIGTALGITIDVRRAQLLKSGEGLVPRHS